MKWLFFAVELSNVNLKSIVLILGQNHGDVERSSLLETLIYEIWDDQKDRLQVNPGSHLDKRDLQIIIERSTSLPSITTLEVYKENIQISSYPTALLRSPFRWAGFENESFTLKTHQMFSVHTSPEEFEKGVFTLNAHQMFSVHTTPEEYKNTTINDLFGFVFEETRSGKSRGYSDVIVIEKFRFQNVCRPHENAKPAFSNSTSLKRVLRSSVFMTD